MTSVLRATPPVAATFRWSVVTKATATLAACATLLCIGGRAQGAATKQQKYEAAQLRAQGKLLSCMDRNSARSILGQPDNSPKCVSSFATTMSAIAAKATKVTDCALGGCRYVDNGDGTVSDLTTGLMWEKKTTDGSVHDVGNAYAWSVSGSAPDGPAFTTFLYSLNTGTFDTRIITGCFANHCDWRLPTVEELLGILDLSLPGCGLAPFPACIDPIFGPTQDSLYWSATNGTDPTMAWRVSFMDGDTFPVTKVDASFFVRAVRGAVKGLCGITSGVCGGACPPGMSCGEDATGGCYCQPPKPPCGSSSDCSVGVCPQGTTCQSVPATPFCGCF